LVKYKALAATYVELESTSSILRKVEILSKLISETPKELLRKIAYLATGEVFPPWDPRKMNLAESLSVMAISRVTGSDKQEITSVLKNKGDLGSAAADLLENRKQSTLARQELTVAGVYDAFEKISALTGVGSMERKIALLSELISNAEPDEAKYIVRTILGQLRIGVGEGILRDAIARAFRVPSGAVEKAYSILNDYGEVAELASRGEARLKDVHLHPGRPLKVMLYPKSESVEEAVTKTGLPVQAEYKYDGFRTQIHKVGDKVTVFTRRLDDITSQFPDIVEAVLASVKAREVILDSESVGIDPATGSSVPFQKISQRIKRKYDIARLVKEVPVETHLFDVLYLDGQNLIDKPLRERLSLLKGIFEPSSRLKIVDHIEASDPEEAKEFYREALAKNVEGIMLKSLSSPYKPGHRVGYGYKLKPETETLDLVVVGAEWGEGKRASWLSSYLLAVRDPKTDEFLTVGKMATGMTEADLKIMTEMFKSLVLSEKGIKVELKPKVVLEVGFQEIQKSSKYASGFALRFPRMVRLRDDKGPDEADTVERVKFLFESRFKRPGSR
jgi:DNA ligase-1